MQAALEYFLDIQGISLRREIPLYQKSRPPLVVASDGRLDDSGPPTIATLIFDPENGSKVGLVATIPVQLIERWSIHKQFISMVEQAAVVTGLVTFIHMFCGRDFYWFEDNSAVLMGLCKGSSSQSDLDAGAASCHMLIASLQASGWFEYAESNANWFGLS